MRQTIHEPVRKNRPCSTALLKRLKDLHPNAIDLSLGRIRRLLDALGRPDLHLPPVVHIAGTNGKGSTIAFLRAIAEAMGKRVHTYTSPHLINFHERITLGNAAGGVPITEDELITCLMQAERANAGEPITFFEITTAAAFLAFSRAPADLLLLETGMGGRLDATNVVERPIATAITPVSFDHMAFLGNSLTSIAQEKAGIIKAGVPCVVGRQNPEALKAIEARSTEINAPLKIFGRDFDVRQQHQKLHFKMAGHEIELPLPNLIGAHQVDNVGTAVAAASVIFNHDLSTIALKEGLTSAAWPARLERMRRGMLHEFVADGTEIWLDGGHNPAGADAVARTLDRLDSSCPVHLIWGMIKTKDARAVIAPFKSRIEHVFTVPIPGEPQAFSAQELAEIAKDAGLNATATNDIRRALMHSQVAFARPGRVLIFGSLYLAGYVQKLHNARPSLMTGPLASSEAWPR